MKPHEIEQKKLELLGDIKRSLGMLIGIGFSLAFFVGLILGVLVYNK